jgi:hypothetical protein
VPQHHDVHSVGDVHLWLEQGTSIHIKTVEPHGDPVELTEDQAGELARILLDFARQAASS